MTKNELDDLDKRIDELQDMAKKHRDISLTQTQALRLISLSRWALEARDAMNKVSSHLEKSNPIYTANAVFIKESERLRRAAEALELKDANIDAFRECLSKFPKESE